MDELLKQTKSNMPNEGKLAAPMDRTSTLLASEAGTKGKAYRAVLSAGSRTKRALGGIFSKLEIDRAWIAILLILLFCAVAFAKLYYPTYVVTMNGVEIGRMKEKAEFQKAVKRVEHQVSDILGQSYQMSIQPDYRFVYTYGNQYVSSASMESRMLDQVEEIEKLYALAVDDVIVGAAKDANTLQMILDDVLDSYRDKDTASANFLEAVTIEEQYIPADTLQDSAKIFDTLTAVKGEDISDVLGKDESLATVAARNNLTLTELLQLNPSVTVGNAKAGQTLVVQEKAPFLSVMAEKMVQYTEEIPFETEKVNDATLYQGDTKVLTEGINGTRSVKETQVLKNGKVVEKNRVQETIVTEPTTQVMAVGTAPRPITEPKGSFIWPTFGHVTSQFGYRTIFGSTSFHSGIDIANPYGTSIKAADGGTVVYTGCQGTYGKLIKVDHGNGRLTYYAHCSSILVSVGDKVYQGQLIGKTGSTGRATGNHLHFEVHINGTVVNPLQYLS